MFLFRYFLISLLSLPLITQADIQHEPPMKLEKVASGLAIPWGMAMIDDLLYVTQREGKLTTLNITNGEQQSLEGLPEDIMVIGQGGLLDIAPSPTYKEDGWLYFSYNKAVGDKGTTTLARAKLSDKKLTDWEDIFIAKAISNKGVHYAGRITFDHQGHVFMSIGDRGHRPNGQDTLTHAGTIVRLNMDGSVPADNPYVNSSNALPEIWSYGHRNPQGLFFNTSTQQLWAIEHGPRGGDEINLIQPGTNYGWAEISYGKEYWAPIAVGTGTHKEGMAQPVFKYIPSIAPSSLIQYQGDAFPMWKNKLISGALAGQHLNIVTIDDNNTFAKEERTLNHIGERIRNVIEMADGRLLIATDEGNIYTLSPQ